MTLHAIGGNRVPSWYHRFHSVLRFFFFRLYLR